jgi:hypothetical protein
MWTVVTDVLGWKALPNGVKKFVENFMFSGGGQMEWKINFYVRGYFLDHVA